MPGRRPRIGPRPVLSGVAAPRLGGLPSAALRHRVQPGEPGRAGLPLGTALMLAELLGTALMLAELLGTALMLAELLGDEERQLQGLHVVQARVAERLV